MLPSFLKHTIIHTPKKKNLPPRLLLCCDRVWRGDRECDEKQDTRKIEWSLLNSGVTRNTDAFVKPADKTGDEHLHTDGGRIYWS